MFKYIQSITRKSLLALKMNLKKNLLYKFVLILLLSPVMSYLIYQEYVKEGISTRILLLGIFNFMFYIVGIYQVMRISKK